MKKQPNIKKLVLLNLPYLLMGLFATNFGEAWRLAVGVDASQKLLSFFSALPGALQSFWPSLHPMDLLVGLCCGAGLWLAVYLKSKNAKKYRRGMEYGSARWGTHEDIAPYIDPVFQNNVILTKTESLTMSSRPKDPKTARNKNVLVIGGSGSGKTRFWLKPNPNFKYTADANPKNAFDIEAFLSARLKPKSSEVYDVYEVDATGDE